jgi:methylmalonyl-CoA mutase, C-terminal domain
MILVPRILDLTRDQSSNDVVVMVGGTIPTEDIPELRRLGVSGAFTSGSSMEAVIEFIRGVVL